MNKKKIIGLGIVLIIAVCAFGEKLYQHEEWQKNKFSELDQKNETLTNELNEMAGSIEELKKDNEELTSSIDALQKQISDLSCEVDYSENGFNYLAIGNSITVHNKCDYWWNKVGMAATTAENDYFHQVVSYLQDTNEEVAGQAYNFATWETNSSDRSEFLSLLDGYLYSGIDLITIQLSENVTDFSTFDSDYKELVSYLQEHCPEAQIIVISDFWNKEKAEVEKNIANSLGLEFVDLSDIIGDSDYQCGMGTIVYGDDGSEHTVDHSGVARHPGDKGMEYIATNVIEKIKGD